MKTLTSGCENVPAWCTWMTYPICWGHSWWSYPYLLVLYGIRLTQEPACRHLFISWPCSIEKSRFFLLSNQTFKCQRISLAFLTRYGRVMPSTYHEVIRLCIHDKKPSFMTSQVCTSAVGSVKVRSWSWNSRRRISPQSARIHKWIWLLNSASVAQCNDWMCVSDTKRAFESIDPGMLSGKNSLKSLILNLNLTIDIFGDW